MQFSYSAFTSSLVLRLVLAIVFTYFIDFTYIKFTLAYQLYELIANYIISVCFILIFCPYLSVSLSYFSILFCNSFLPYYRWQITNIIINSCMYSNLICLHPTIQHGDSLNFLAFTCLDISSTTIISKEQKEWSTIALIQKRTVSHYYGFFFCFSLFHSHYTYLNN